MPTVLLAYYCTLILIASIIGGMIPVWFQLTHRWMQFAANFVAGVILDIGVLHMLPHAVVDASVAAHILAAATPLSSAAVAVTPTSNTIIDSTSVWWVSVSLLAGMLVMFFIERFFSYHHHDVHDADDTGATEHAHHDHSHHHHEHSHDRVPAHARSGAAGHDISWGGAAFGLALHSVLNGVALAAAVWHGSHGFWLAGFGTFLVIFLHKPFDAMTISMLMARGGWSLGWRHTINGLFSLAIPAGVVVFYFGLMSETTGPDMAARQWYVACALAFSAGTFLCISLSDLLPELQFHSHDRLKLSAALMLGLALAYFVAQLESLTHKPHAPPPLAVPPAAASIR